MIKEQSCFNYYPGGITELTGHDLDNLMLRDGRKSKLINGFMLGGKGDNQRCTEWNYLYAKDNLLGGEMKPIFETDPKILEQLEKAMPNHKFKRIKKSWWPFWNRTCGLCGNTMRHYKAIDKSTGQDSMAEIFICVECGANQEDKYDPNVI